MSVNTPPVTVHWLAFRPPPTVVLLPPPSYGENAPRPLVKSSQAEMVYPVTGDDGVFADPPQVVPVVEPPAAVGARALGMIDVPGAVDVLGAVDAPGAVDVAGALDGLLDGAVDGVVLAPGHGVGKPGIDPPDPPKSCSISLINH